MPDSPPYIQSIELTELVARAREGDDDALDRLCRECYDEVLDFFRQRIPAHAEDLTQTLMADLRRKLEAYHESGRFIAWLRGVAYNMFLTRARSDKRLREDTILTGMAHPNPATSTLFRTAKGQLRKLVTRLPDSLRRAWELHADGYSHAEIAARLGISEGASMTRVHRARAQLFDWLRGSADGTSAADSM